MSIVLKRDGVVQEKETAAYELVRLRRSLLRPFELTVRRAIPFDDSDAWQNEESFSLEDGEGNVLFDGVLKRNRREGSTRRDDTTYEMTGLEAKAERVVLRRGGSARVVYNASPDDAATGDYDKSLAGMSIGAILADVLDTMAAELSGVIGDGSPGGGYLSGELAKLTVVPPKVTFNGNTIPECIRLLMQYHPQFGTFIDPDAKVLRVIDLATLTPKTITVGSDAVLEAHLNFSTDGCHTACQVEGAGELIDREQVLEPAWDEELEATWTHRKSFEYPETYGRVWRRFACPDNNLAPYRVVGDSPRIMVHLTHVWYEQYLTLSNWADVDYENGEVELPWLARQWDHIEQKWEAGTVTMRYTFRYGPISARWPSSGFAGTAYTHRGLMREKVIVDHDAMRITVEGNVSKIEDATHFRDFMLGAKPDELAGKYIAVGANPVIAIVSNGLNLIELAEEPQTWEEGTPYLIFLQDDTEPVFENGTISKMSLRAREWLKGHQDEKYEGVVPVSGIDLSVELGQKINFAGTNNPFFDTLGATLVEVVHDFKANRTELVLTSEQTLDGQPAWQQVYADALRRQEQLNLASEMKLLKRSAGLRRTFVIDGDRDPNMAESPEGVVTSLGRYGDGGVLRGAVKLQEDDTSDPSVKVSREAENNSLKLSANFGTEIETVSLDEPESGDTNLVADAGHRHVLEFDSTLRDNEGVLGHALKEAFGPGQEVQITPYFKIVWDPVYGHILDVIAT